MDGSADGDTYLISSIKREMWNYSETYLDRGADPNVTSAGKTALENMVAIVNKRAQQGDSVSNTHKALIARLVAALPAPQSQPSAAPSIKKWFCTIPVWSLPTKPRAIRPNRDMLHITL